MTILDKKRTKFSKFRQESSSSPAEKETKGNSEAVELAIFGGSKQREIFKEIQQVLNLPNCKKVRPCLLLNEAYNPYECCMHSKCSLYRELFALTKEMPP